MRKLVFAAIAIFLALTVTLVTARGLPRIIEREKEMFKTMVKSYFSPLINGWGIGLNTSSDSYVVVKFHIVSVKILPRIEIANIIRQAKSENVSEWSIVRDRLKLALDANGTTINKGRIQINKEKYVLTNITVTDTNLEAIIRAMPDFGSCKMQNISAEECEVNSTKVGDLSLTKKNVEFEKGKERVWAGSLNFNETAYTFVALILPRSRI
jgi:hypothetical protein